jgi:excisionase family DNA binding protein
MKPNWHMHIYRIYFAAYACLSLKGGDRLQQADMLTSRAVAQMLRVKPETLAMKARIGEIPGVKIGRAWRFRRETIERLLGGPPPAPEPSPAVG